MSEERNLTATQPAVNSNELLDRRASQERRPPPQDSFECVWCKKAGLSPEEYTREPQYYGGYDNATGLPICEDCRDGIAELVYLKAV
jgi:hypothetical protein